MSHDDRIADPGLAAERTALAWTRSALSLAAIGALITRAATDSHVPLLGYPVGITLVIAATVLWAYGGAAYRSGRSQRPPDRAQPSPAGLRMIAAATAAIAAFALALALVIVLD